MRTACEAVFGLPIGRSARRAARAPTLRALRRQSMAEEIEVGERKRRESPRGVLRQAAVSDLREPPQPFHDVERMLAAGPDARVRIPVKAAT